VPRKSKERKLHTLVPGLKKHRILASLTQEELAQRVGIHRVSINELENLKRPARPRNLKHLAEVLGVETRDLVENSH
jgi:transcriptional regulator with XRE-family HTH domain